MPESLRGDAFTLEHAEELIANVHGITDLLGEYHALSDGPIPNTPGIGNGSGLYSNNGVPQAITDAGMLGSMPLVQTDTAKFTVTAASTTQLSAAFNIAASDCNLGSSYTLTAWGNGQWGSTQQSLNLFERIAGNAIGLTPTIGSTQFNASAVFRWWVQLNLLCTATGAGGTFSASLTGTMSQTANNCLSQTGLNGSIGFAGGTGTDASIDTTAVIGCQLNASWSSTVGSPTITCNGSIFERKGP